MSTFSPGNVKVTREQSLTIKHNLHFPGSIYGDMHDYIPSYDKPKEKDRRESDKRERERGGRDRDHHRYHDRDREHNRDRDRGRKRESERERDTKRSYFEKPAEEVCGLLCDGTHLCHMCVT